MTPSDHYPAEKAPINSDLPGELQRYTITEPAVQQATAALAEALSSSDVEPEKMRAAWGAYADTVESFVDSREDAAARAEAQIAALINKATIFHQVGNTERYLEELDAAEVYAANMGMNALSGVLDAEIREQAESLPLTPGVVILMLRGIIDDADREHIRELVSGEDDMDATGTAVGAAWGMILEVGGDPEETLGSIGILKQDPSRADL